MQTTATTDQYLRNKIAELTDAVKSLTAQRDTALARKIQLNGVATRLSDELEETRRDRDEWRRMYQHTQSVGYKLKGERGGN